MRPFRHEVRHALYRDPLNANWKAVDVKPVPVDFQLLPIILQFGRATEHGIPVDL